MTLPKQTDIYNIAAAIELTGRQLKKLRQKEDVLEIELLEKLVEELDINAKELRLGLERTYYIGEDYPRMPLKLQDIVHIRSYTPLIVILCGASLDSHVQFYPSENFQWDQSDVSKKLAIRILEKYPFVDYVAIGIDKLRLYTKMSKKDIEY